MDQHINKMKRAAFIELTIAHSECIYSQLLYLKTSGYHVELICNAVHVCNVVNMKQIADKTTFITVERKYYDTICDYIIRQRFDKIIIGSAFYKHYGNMVNRLTAGGCRADLFAVLHSLDKLVRTDGRLRRMGKIDRFFVLADYVAANAPRQIGFEYAAIPLIFQPDYPSVPIDKPDGEIWIAVPGAVNFKRRDYMALIPPERCRYAENIKFILLGWDYGDKTIAFRNKLKDRGVDRNFIFFPRYVDVAAFQSWIMKCDYVMPLIHEGCDSFKDYMSVKITGNLNVALTYRKPMLCDVAFGAIDEYAAHSILYERGQLCGFVNTLAFPDVGQFYSDDFERAHSLEVLAKRYAVFLEM